MSKIAARIHPLRLAYVRTLQAILAIHLTRIDVDEALGGDPKFLDGIEDGLVRAQRDILKLAVAERINLGEDDDE